MRERIGERRNWLRGRGVALVGKEDSDASLLSGVYFVSKVNCSISGIEPNVYATNQDDLHPDTYISYARTYTSDFDAYVNREVDLLTWDTTYEIEGFGYAYEADILPCLPIICTCLIYSKM